MSWLLHNVIADEADPTASLKGSLPCVMGKEPSSL